MPMWNIVSLRSIAKSKECGVADYCGFPWTAMSCNSRVEQRVGRPRCRAPVLLDIYTKPRRAMHQNGLQSRRMHPESELHPPWSRWKSR